MDVPISMSVFLRHLFRHRRRWVCLRLFPHRSNWAHLSDADRQERHLPFRGITYPACRLGSQWSQRRALRVSPVL